MENLQRIVMLIDADNTQIGKLEESLWQLAQRHT